jgi:hypothetical protein
MELKAVADYLEAQGQGVMEKTIFIGEMPAACVTGVLLLDRYSGTSIDPYLPKYRNTGFRVALRNADYERGMAHAKAINGALYIQADTQMPGILVKRMVPQNDPRPYRRSLGGYWEFEVDFECSYVIEDPDLRL